MSSFRFMTQQNKNFDFCNHRLTSQLLFDTKPLNYAVTWCNAPDLSYWYGLHLPAYIAERPTPECVVELKWSQ
jgi:hypothetical protein